MCRRPVGRRRIANRIGAIAAPHAVAYLSAWGWHGQMRTMHDLTTTDHWDDTLGRFAREATVTNLATLAARGRVDGARLAKHFTPAVGGLFVSQLATGIRTAGGMHGADALLSSRDHSHDYERSPYSPGSARNLHAALVNDTAASAACCLARRGHRPS